MAQELNIRLNTDEKKPLYRQIYEYIRGEIRSGGLEAGERLPSTRALASGLHVARSTAELAYSQLLSEGYIRAKKNSGYYVNEIENLAELHFEERRTDGACPAAGNREEPVPDLLQKEEESRRGAAEELSVPTLSAPPEASTCSPWSISNSLYLSEVLPTLQINTFMSYTHT